MDSSKEIGAMGAVGPAVSVAMVTFNQERYIAQAIESVLMQVTNFPVQLVIGEDCSTDATRTICKSYAEKYRDKILLLENETNLGLVRNYKRVFDNCTGKYIALLEGDDYWVDACKLQKQYDVLEKDEQIGLVHTACYRLQESNGELVRIEMPYAIPVGYVYDQIFEENFIVSVSVCFRRDLFEKHVDFNYFLEHNFRTIDLPVWTELAAHSKVEYLSDPTAVYRLRDGSVSHGKSFKDVETFALSALESKKYYRDKYPLKSRAHKGVQNRVYAGLLLDAVVLKDEEGRKRYSELVRIRSMKTLAIWLVARNPTLRNVYLRFRQYR